MNAVLPLLARICVAALFIVAGIGKVMAFSGTVGYMAKVGFPAPEVMTAIAIAFELGGGLLLLIGWKTRWVAWGLTIFVVIATFAAHRFWDVDVSQMSGQRTQFLKNFAIIGALLMMAAFGPGPNSADKR
jgi:putative oxidoreductase